MQADPPVAGVSHLGRRVLRWVEGAGLIVIAFATVIAAAQEVGQMIDHRMRLTDLLLPFIYLEVFAMVGLYLESGQPPVRMPLYIGMVALAY